jgi:hypothetical protein
MVKATSARDSSAGTGKAQFMLAIMLRVPTGCNGQPMPQFQGSDQREISVAYWL